MSATENGFGSLLREWRESSGLSQMDLGLGANVSSRHLSFVETGRAHPSQSLVLRLGEALTLPLREQNLLLLAAGYAPVYGERSLGAPEMNPVSQALKLILKSHEPYPAFVLDRAFNIILANEAFTTMLSLQLPQRDPNETVNAMRLVFSSDHLRPLIRNWELVASVLLARIRERLRLSNANQELQDLYQEICAIPDIAEMKVKRPHNPQHAFLIPMEIEYGDRLMSWFSTIATIGSPLDVTLEELQIESLFPANRETQDMVREMMTPGSL